MRKAPSLRNNNGAVQIRVRIDGKDGFINRLGSWKDPAAVARAQALSAQIWSDYCEGKFDRTLRAYQPIKHATDRKLVDALKKMAEGNRQGRTIHAARTLEKYGKTICNKEDVNAFVNWMQEQGLQNRTIQGILCECRRVLPDSRELFKSGLRFKHRSVQSDVLSKEEIRLVLNDLKSNDSWYYPLFALWLSTGLRNGELRALTWDCIHWEEGEIIIHKTLRVDGLSSHNFIPACTKTGKERVIPFNDRMREVLTTHKAEMEDRGLYARDGLVFLTPISHKNVYDSLLGKVWKRSFERCGLKPRRLYAQRHSFVSHALAMGNSVADLAQIAGHNTETMLKIYAKPTGRVQLPTWA